MIDDSKKGSSKKKIKLAYSDKNMQQLKDENYQLEQLQMRLTPNTFGKGGHSNLNSNRKKFRNMCYLNQKSTESPISS